MKLLTALLLSVASTTTTTTPLFAQAFVPTSSRRRRVHNELGSRQFLSTRSTSSLSLFSTQPTTRRNQLPPFHPPIFATKTTSSSLTTERIYAAAFSPIQRKIATTDTSVLADPRQAYWLIRIENWYRQALAIKCPFLRRRASDALDVLEGLVRQACLTPTTRALLGPPVALRCEGAACYKERNLPTAMVMARLLSDWKPVNHKGYYITGKLSTELYRDDCYFDGPDPDMPVHGLRKYLNAASQLFETKTSTAELLQLTHDPTTDLITARWRMKGVLRLPWRPRLPVVTGTTTYYRDADGLIYRHGETWDISVAHAFLYTLWPSLARRIWPNHDTSNGNTANAAAAAAARAEMNEITTTSTTMTPSNEGALDYP